MTTESNAAHTIAPPTVPQSLESIGTHWPECMRHHVLSVEDLTIALSKEVHCIHLDTLTGDASFHLAIVAPQLAADKLSHITTISVQPLLRYRNVLLTKYGQGLVELIANRPLLHTLELALPLDLETVKQLFKTGLREPGTLRKLSIKGCQFATRGAKLELFQSLQQLQGTLEEFNCELVPLDGSCLEALRTFIKGSSVLRSLHLCCEELLASSLGRPLEKSASLETLCLRGIAEDDVVLTLVRSTISGLSALKVLDLSHNPLLSYNNVESSRPSYRSAQSIVLDIRNCHIANTVPTGVLSAFSILTSVNLSDNPIRDSGCKTLVDCLKSSQTSVEELVLSGCQITSKGLESLSQWLATAQKCRSLDLSDNQIEAQGVECVLNAFMQHEGLRSSLQNLNLSTNRLGDEGVHHIGEMIQATNSCLKCIQLSFTDVRESGALALADYIQHNRSLKSLNLSMNRIGDSGLMAILTAKHMIVEVAAECSYVTDEGAAQLVKSVLSLTHLRTLRLGGNNFLSNIGIASLRQAQRNHGKLAILLE